ncbi:early nodulin-like protein 7 [Tasmannia lanceolata]|uniref:early nodulin-like protein 7 n=1 Tax=Tasmannia lanceolata TaxID=3420 RepID=UPI0040643300
MVPFLGILVVLLASMNMAVGASNEFKVGNSEGWKEPIENHTEIYNEWAAKIRFEVGDSVYFEYKENDTVLVVDKSGYYHCNTSNPITTFNDGKTIFKLDRPGPFYFISGAPNHCKKGQRLIVDVLTQHSPPRPWDAPSPSPLPSSAMSPSISALFTLLMAFTTLEILLLGSPCSLCLK